MQGLGDALAILDGRLPADCRIGAGAEPLGEVCAQLQNGARTGLLEGLRVGIGDNELHAFEFGADHVLDGIAAAAADADHLDHGLFAVAIHQFKHGGVSL